MRINKASLASGVSLVMIRRYENFGLLPKVRRLSNGYRDYSSGDVQRLKFIQKLTGLGFDLGEIKQLLAPWDQKRPKKDVKAFAEAKAKELREKWQVLAAAERVLLEMAALEKGAPRPPTPIEAFAELSASS